MIVGAGAAIVLLTVGAYLLASRPGVPTAPSIAWCVPPVATLVKAASNGMGEHWNLSLSGSLHYEPGGAELLDLVPIARNEVDGAEVRRFEVFPSKESWIGVVRFALTGDHAIQSWGGDESLGFYVATDETRPVGGTVWRRYELLPAKHTAR